LLLCEKHSNLIHELADDSERRELLIKCAATSLNSKLISHQKDFFAPIVVDAVLSLDEDLSLDMIGVKKIPGGALEVTSDLLSSEIL
jgi:T-complex protein 1 subunit eta